MKGIEMSDDKLIFLISLPRSGSTMLQKILGAHTDVFTRSETWLMLHPLYSLKSEGIETRYDAAVAADGVRDFIDELPVDGEAYYYQQLRKCYLSLYGKYLKSNGKQRFLDKTPRYYEVFDELQQTFPNAKFIVLYRNPMAVFSSILETWVRGRYEMLNSYKADLEQGVEFLQRDFSGYSNTYLIRYEELLAEPETQIEKLFNFLKLPNQPECITYGKETTEKWLYGDPSTVYEKSRPDAAHADAWLKQLDKPESWKLISDYFQKLGKTCFDHLGYSFEDVENAIADAWQKYPQIGTVNLSLYNFLRSDKENLARARSNNVLLNKNITDLQGKLPELENSLDQVRQSLDQKEQELSAKDHELEQVRQSLDQKEQELSAKNHALDQANHSLEKKEQELSAKNKGINKIEAELANSDAQLMGLLYSFDELAKHKALLSPKSKYIAYKKMIQKFIAVKMARKI